MEHRQVISDIPWFVLELDAEMKRVLAMKDNAESTKGDSQ